MHEHGGGTKTGVIMGEIHSGLLQNSTGLTSEAAAELLTLIPQHGVRTWERPIRQAASPEILTGVDCDLPAHSGARVRGVGTVVSEVWVTGGHLLQSCTRVRIIPATTGRRLPWSHYLSRPGVIESMTPVRPDDLIPGFLSQVRHPTALDLGSIAGRTMGVVQGSRLLDHRPPFRAARTQLRWTAQALPRGGNGVESIRFSIESGTLRTISIDAADDVAERLPELCRDVARHDWLLSALISMIDAARTGRRQKAEVVRKLRPAVDHLLHAWMPAARLPEELLAFWREVERHSGFTTQWESAVSRIRDQLALATAEYLAQPATVISLPVDAAARST